MSADFPVKSKTIITPNKVSILVHCYSNCLFIVISEIDCGSTGTLVEFRKELIAGLQIEGGDSDNPDIVYDIKVLFGVEKPEILLAARVFGSRIHQGTIDKPILFGIGLKRFNKALLEEVAETLTEILKNF